MSNFRKLSGLVLLTTLAATSTYANSSATLFLGGNVASVINLAIAPNGANNSNLDIVNGESAKSIATATETSNVPAGYKVFAFATNGALVHSSEPTESTSYQISYDGGAYTSIPTTPLTPVELKNSGALSGLTVDTSAVLINVTAKPDALEGSFTDLITFSLVDL